MTSKGQQYIVCAVRGGPESRETVAHAIELALARGARLTFLQVMDAEFLDHARVAPLSVRYRELQSMAQFTTRILCERAERKGVQGPSCLVRTGNIQRQIRRFVTEAGSGLAGDGPASVQVEVVTPSTGTEGWQPLPRSPGSSRAT